MNRLGSRLFKTALAAAVAGASFLVTTAIANYAYRDGNGTLQYIFSFVCQSTTVCPGQVLIDSSGTEKATPQNPAVVGGTNDGTTPRALSTDAAGRLNVNASVSASISGFQPSASGARGTPLSVTGSDTSGTLPTGTVVVVTNAGASTLMYCNVNGVAATAFDQPIAPSGGWFAFTIPSGITTLHCIAPGGSTTANTVGGTGLPTGTGGGGGGGSGGAVNLTQILGAAPSATNQLWMSPATGATFPVSGTFWPYSLGQQLAASSVPVVLTAAQLSTLTPLSTVAATQSGSWAVSQTSGPWTQNLTQWDGVALGAPSAYGTSPGAVNVPGFNAFITNVPAVSQSGSWTATVVQGTGSNLHVVCDSGCSSSTAPADESAFTFGTTSQSPVGGVYQTTATNNPLTNGQMGAWQFTANRAGFVNPRNAAGAEIFTAAAPGQVTGANGTFPATQSGTWTVQPGNTPNTTPWLASISQGGNAAAVKAASTAAAVTDPAVVVQNAYEQAVLGTVGSSASCAAGSNSTWIQCAYATYAAINNGVATIGSAVPLTAIYQAGQAVNAEPAKATNGNAEAPSLDLVGKQVTSPYANRENQLRCAVTITASTSATTCTGMGAQGSGVKIYITDFCATRSDAGTTAATVTLNDSATTPVDVPNNGGGGGFCHTYNVPLVVAANTAFQVTPGTSLTSYHVSASGFAGY
jgi:hypothetical protein